MSFESSGIDKENLFKINKLLFFDIWKNETINLEQIDLLNDIVQNNFNQLYGRKRNKEIINIGLNHPSTYEIDNQTLMFGPAGNFPEYPEIIISGISTSITAANGIALNLKKKDIKSVNIDEIRKIYLQNIYKGGMYKKFKKEWEQRSNGSIYENDFHDLFNIIEGKKAFSKKSKIMLTQATLHGIATYYEDSWHKRTAWSAPSTKVFKNEVSEYLFKEFFLESVLIERFINNPKSKFLFLMGNDIYNKVRKSFEKEINTSLSLENVIFCENINKDFKLEDFDIKVNSKYIIKIKHSAA